MNYSIRLVSIVGVLCLSLLPAGCQGPASSAQPTPAASVAGGPVITATCIVRYFRDGQAPYITQQQHRFVPAAGSLTVTAQEPANTYTFTLTRNQFSPSRPPSEFLSGLPANFVDASLATAVFYAFTGGADLLATDAMETGEAIKLEGRWYQPLAPTWPTSALRAILLKDMDTHRIDSVGLVRYHDAADAQGDMLDSKIPVDRRWLAKSYNLRYSSELDRLVPRTLDLFDVRDGIASKKLMVQIHYQTVSTEASSKRPSATEKN